MESRSHLPRTRRYMCNVREKDCRKARLSKMGKRCNVFAPCFLNTFLPHNQRTRRRCLRWPYISPPCTMNTPHPQICYTPKGKGNPWHSCCPLEKQNGLDMVGSWRSLLTLCTILITQRKRRMSSHVMSSYTRKVHKVRQGQSEHIVCTNACLVSPW